MSCFPFNSKINKVKIITHFQSLAITLIKKKIFNVSEHADIVKVSMLKCNQL